MKRREWAAGSPGLGRAPSRRLGRGGVRFFPRERCQRSRPEGLAWEHAGRRVWAGWRLPFLRFLWGSPFGDLGLLSRALSPRERVRCCRGRMRARLREPPGSLRCGFAHWLGAGGESEEAFAETVESPLRSPAFRGFEGGFGRGWHYGGNYKNSHFLDLPTTPHGRHDSSSHNLYLYVQKTR